MEPPVPRRTPPRPLCRRRSSSPERRRRSSEKFREHGGHRCFPAHERPPLLPRARTRLCQSITTSPGGFIAPSRRPGHAPTPPLARDHLRALHALTAHATYQRTPASRGEHQPNAPRSPRVARQRPLHATLVHGHARAPNARTHARPTARTRRAQRAQCAPIPALDTPGSSAVAYSPFINQRNNLIILYCNKSLKLLFKISY